jgi:tripartite-type tricarboxylate transporter receptor subunit TctC
MNLKPLLTSLAAAAAAVLVMAPAQAQWPERPVTLVVPFPPGGGLDITARQIAPLLSKELGQPAVVENRPGATGSIGVNAVAKAKPDGNLLLWSSLTSHSIHAALYGDRVPYDLGKDLAPVTVFGTIPLVFVVNPSVPAKTLPELIALAKQKPGSLSFATAGNGSVQHLSGEMFQRMAGVQLLHVPYKGIGPALNDLMGGQVHFSIESLAATQPHIRSGKLRPLAVAAPERVATIPDVPTTAEAGLKGFEVPVNLFLAAPAGTPAPVMSRLNEAMKRIVLAPEMKERLQTQAVVASHQSPAAAAQLLREEFAKWSKVIKDAGIKPE